MKELGNKLEKRKQIYQIADSLKKWISVDTLLGSLILFFYYVWLGDI